MTIFEKIRYMWVSLFIPKNTPYCHHNFKKGKNGLPCAKPCKYWCMKYSRYTKGNNCKMEYCKYLKKFLDIQDQVKDCGINDGENL